MPLSCPVSASAFLGAGPKAASLESCPIQPFGPPSCKFCNWCKAEVTTFDLDSAYRLDPLAVDDQIAEVEGLDLKRLRLGSLESTLSGFLSRI